MKTPNFKLFPLFWLLMVCLSSLAQAGNKVDSLQNVLKNMPSDTLKAKTYGLLVWYYARYSIDTEIEKKHIDSSMVLSKALDFHKGVAYAHLRYGNLDKRLGNYQQAIRHIDSALQYYTTIGDSTRVADGLFDLAAIHRSSGNYEKSLSYYLRVLDISEMEGNPISLASTLTSIGLLNRLLKQYDQAISNYQKALRILDSVGSSKRMLTSLNGLGTVYMEIGEYDTAKSHFLKLLNITREQKYEREMGYQLANLGNLEIQLGNPGKALEYHLQALQVREKLPRKADLALSLADVGNTYLQLGNHSQSRQYLAKGLVLAREIPSKPLIRDLYKMLADLSLSEHNYKEAYHYRTLYEEAKDSILNADVNKQFQELQVKYETEKKDQRITLLAQEKQLQEKEIQRQATLKNVFIGGAILTVLLASLLWYTFRQRLKNQRTIAAKDQEIKEVNFRRQLSELEMKALQAQINPHFIFNCMNSINQMIKKGNNQNASKYLSKFSKLIRSILENAEDTEVSLKDELATLKAYIQLEALRFKEDVNFKMDIQDSIDLENTYLPSMVLQPFVENAIWHGLRHKKVATDGKISIAIRKEKEQLLCLIEDNGVGRQKAFELQEKSILKRKSLGVKITEDRLRLLSKELQKQLVRITDLKDPTGTALGTRVEVSIPIS